MKFYKIAIVGGGASGLTSAIALKKAGFDDFVLLERLDRVGKKFISTGNGQGNLTNVQISQDFYDGNEKSFVLPAIQKYGFNDNFILETAINRKASSMSNLGKILDEIYFNNSSSNDITKTTKSTKKNFDFKGQRDIDEDVTSSLVSNPDNVEV